MKKSKVALITGAARRIGAQIAKELHSAGFSVVLHVNHSMAEAAELLAELTTKRAGSAWILQADLRQHANLQALIDQAQQKWGGLDVLVNNASCFYPTPLGSASEQQWAELFDVNVKAPFFLSQAAAPFLAKDNGCIINITDIYAAKPLLDFSLYSLTKAALVAMTQALAKELAPNVRVNAVSPGAILWPADISEQAKQAKLAEIPLQRQGEAADIAKTVRFLVLEGAYISGQVLAVDGGKSLS